MLFYSVFGFISGCNDVETKLSLQEKKIQTSQSTYDAGILHVGNRETFAITLQSIGDAPVFVKDIIAADQEHFVILENWATIDFDNNVGTPLDATLIGEEASEKDIYINFRPDEERTFRSRISILSDDSTALEQTEEGWGIYRTTVRGVGTRPCAELYPSFLDFGNKPSGASFSEEITIKNCGKAMLVVSGFNFEGHFSFASGTSTPLYILQGEEHKVRITFTPGDMQTAEYQESREKRATFSIITVDPDFEATIDIIGNSCNDSIKDEWDGDGDGWSVCGGDCNDGNQFIYPGAPEVTNNRDDNCNGNIDENILNFPNEDDDGDGYTDEEGDCNDYDASIHPNAAETINMIDDNCDGIFDNNTTYFDDDGDGYSEREGDCDDSNPDVTPLKEEMDNQIDDNCDGNIDEGFSSYDDDGDGFSEDDGDCNDQNIWVYPQATEDCDDTDNDCDGLIDEGNEGQEFGVCIY